MVSELVEKVARALCEADERNPDALEPGNTPYGDEREIVDGTAKGGPAFYLWRVYVPDATAALEASGIESLQRRLAEVEGALSLTVPIIEDERAVMFDSYKQLSGRYKGQVIDREAKKDIARMDAALNAARSALSTESQGGGK